MLLSRKPPGLIQSILSREELGDRAQGQPTHLKAKAKGDKSMSAKWRMLESV